MAESCGKSRNRWQRYFDRCVAPAPPLTLPNPITYTPAILIIIMLGARGAGVQAMMDLKSWLRDQGLTVRELALELEVPLKTAQEWVYRDVVPSAENQDRLTDYVISHCAHYWVIDRPSGPLSEGVCQRCDEHREFSNSGELANPWIPPGSKKTPPRSAPTN